MPKQEIKDSEIVKALADIASKGRYDIRPPEARQMNVVFELVAGLINRMEAAEKEETNDNTE